MYSEEVQGKEEKEVYDDKDLANKSQGEGSSCQYQPSVSGQHQGVCQADIQSE